MKLDKVSSDIAAAMMYIVSIGFAVFFIGAGIVKWLG